ncbi:MAG TPA: hemin uptake protein HemP [Paraburkholderia sp.]|jgi:hemin uptake protein HemP|nr:hemin uptake protein HemP [Paraburkholderia sp.]
MRDPNRSSTLSMRRPSGSTSTAPTAQPASATPAAATQAPAADDRSLRSDALLQGRSHVNIVHNGETYQLRATRLGKLILTK